MSETQDMAADEMTLLQKYLPDSFLESIGDLEAKIEESELTQREYLAFVLAEATDKTGKKSAEIMGITEGTYWGKLGRARDKKDAAKATTELVTIE
jgi:predicted DNA-binding protein (UPF0251 family)